MDGAQLPEGNSVQLDLVRLENRTDSSTCHYLNSMPHLNFCATITIQSTTTT